MGPLMVEQTEATTQNTFVLSRFHDRTEKNPQDLPTGHPASPRRKLHLLFFWSLGSLLLDTLSTFPPIADMEP